jgi:D-arabinose 1-dehydrogenase-like Zn-dependent alcohol dehydrogenase
MFEPALRSLMYGGRQVAITSTGDPRVSFNLIDFYHNLSGCLECTVADITDGLRSGFETGALRPPPIEIVPFEKAVDVYSRVAAGQAIVKQVLSFSDERKSG